MSTQPTHRSEPHATNGTGPLRTGHGKVLGCLLISCIVLTPGCGWGKKTAEPNTATSAPGNGNWLCEAGKAADDWDCIQSEDIKPKLKALESRPAAIDTGTPEIRTPQPVTNQVPTQGPTQGPTPPGVLPPPASPEVLPLSVPPEAPDALDAPAAPKSVSPSTRNQRPLTTASPQKAAEPAYAKFAYRPDQPVRIIDLPKNFYAAQILAVSTKKQIEDFVVAENLYNMSAARIELDGRVLYVLLLGVYETKEFAQQAIAAMPAQVQDMEPWIRPIEGLQDAMTRGDRLAAVQ